MHFANFPHEGKKENELFGLILKWDLLHLSGKRLKYKLF